MIMLHCTYYYHITYLQIGDRFPTSPASVDGEQSSTQCAHHVKTGDDEDQREAEGRTGVQQEVPEASRGVKLRRLASFRVAARRV